MSQFFDYSKYYNLLYKDKDYLSEVNYIDSLIKEFHPKPNAILDIGCGTGRHASLLEERGYKVWGIDLSDQMLEIANLKSNSNLAFSQGDIRNFKLNKTFDVITSLFHVMSYQTSNADVASSFKSVFNHLNHDGVFIFDCWYGPAVLLDLPITRIKRMEDERTKVIRLSEPSVDLHQSTVEVNFEVGVVDKQNQSLQTIVERHLMRYFFQNELHLFAEASGFRILNFFTWLTKTTPDKTSWYVTVICKKE